MVAGLFKARGHHVDVEYVFCLQDFEVAYRAGILECDAEGRLAAGSLIKVKAKALYVNRHVDRLEERFEFLDGLFRVAITKYSLAQLTNLSVSTLSTYLAQDPQMAASPAP